MRDKAGMKFECIFEEPLDFIDIDYTHLNRTVRYEQRPHGEWIFKHNSSDIWCSNCDENFDEIPQKFLFCPNCGARMKEGEAE